MLVMGPFDWLAKAVEAGGRTALTIAALCVILVAFLADRFFGREKSVTVRLVIWFSVFLGLAILLAAVMLREKGPGLGSKNEPNEPPDGGVKIPSAETNHPPDAFCDEDPATKIRYVYELSFDPHDHMTIPLKRRGGDSTNPGHEWANIWTAPGPIYDVRCRHLGTHEEIEVCRWFDNVARVEGWLNGQGGTTYMEIRWKQPCVRSKPPSN